MTTEPIKPRTEYMRLNIWAVVRSTGRSTLHEYRHPMARVESITGTEGLNLLRNPMKGVKFALMCCAKKYAKNNGFEYLTMCGVAISPAMSLNFMKNEGDGCDGSSTCANHPIRSILIRSPPLIVLSVTQIKYVG